MKSDLGEVNRVKDSTVSSYVIDRANANKVTKIWVDEWKEKLQSCNIGSSEFSVLTQCWQDFGDNIVKGDNDLDVIPQIPDITVVKYRTIATDINGDKAASGYKYVACIPKGKADDQIKWFDIASNDDASRADETNM